MGGVTDAGQADHQLIRLLADGQFHSGSELGETLGISRAAIWKRISRLSALGLDVDSVKGRGYRLTRPLSLLDPEALADGLPASATLHYQLITDSTNQDALALADSAATAQVVVAESQRAGRGRRGRVWQSPFAASLYLSIRYPLACGMAGLGGLSLAMGVATAQALRTQIQGLPVGLKWPNDVLVAGAKLGGILIEVAGEVDEAAVVVVGTGINVSMPLREGQAIDQRWVDLASCSDQVLSRTELAVALINAQLEALALFSQSGFAPFVAAFADYDLCAGQPVTVYSAGHTQEGLAVGVNDSGALLLEVDGVRHPLHGGEVSLRLK